VGTEPPSLAVLDMEKRGLTISSSPQPSAQPPIMTHHCQLLGTDRRYKLRASHRNPHSPRQAEDVDQKTAP